FVHLQLRSALVPYATLFRSSVRVGTGGVVVARLEQLVGAAFRGAPVLAHEGGHVEEEHCAAVEQSVEHGDVFPDGAVAFGVGEQDRKSTRLNSSHVIISYSA